MEQRGDPLHLITAAQAVPPIAVSIAHLAGFHLSDVAILVTILYTLVMMFILIKDKIYQPWRQRKRYDHNHSCPHCDAEIDLSKKQKDL